MCHEPTGDFFSQNFLGTHTKPTKIKVTRYEPTAATARGAPWQLSTNSVSGGSHSVD